MKLHNIVLDSCFIFYVALRSKEFGNQYFLFSGQKEFSEYEYLTIPWCDGFESESSQIQLKLVSFDFSGALYVMGFC